MLVQALIGAVDGAKRVAVEINLARTSTHLVLPRDLLEQVGARPTGTKRFKRSDGRRIDASVGEVELTLRDQTRVVPCVYADPGTQPTLGDTVLEPFGLVIDASTANLVARASELLWTSGEGRSPKS